MKWKNLIENKCPKCGGDWDDVEIRSNVFFCECGFRIGSKRYEEVVSSVRHRNFSKYHREMEEKRQSWD